jgi:hypothetical protein
MKKIGLFLLSMLAITLLAGGNALAQGDNTFYFTAYFSNANTTGAPDATLRLINDGSQSTSLGTGFQPNGTMYASIYTFDDSQEMQECCNCTISADGILSESVDLNLTSNPLTGGQEEGTRGVIKILTGINPDPTNNRLKPGLRGTITHIQAPAIGNAQYYVSETPLARSNLSVAERQDLEITCGFVMYLGSGQGVCSCTPEGSDF